MKKAKIEPLPRVDHSQIQYTPFLKVFYRESPELQALPAEFIKKRMIEEEIHVSSSVSGEVLPRPLQSFEQTAFDGIIIQEMTRLGYNKPTAIQAQAIPLILQGRDVLGLAKTGSGKTLAYAWPMLHHIVHRSPASITEGPLGLILAPTRELANQIYSEVRRFAKFCHVEVVVVTGGAGKWEMTKALKECSSIPFILVATPGRLIEMIRIKATSLSSVTMLVLDEADRMFEMGFEYQMRSIVQNTRPDRQLLMFSATMKKRIENFAREMLTKEVRVVIGTIGQANTDIHQVVELVESVEDKWPWLAAHIDDFAANGKVLIFVLSKAGTEEVALRLRNWFVKRQLDIAVDCLHGDKDQSDRSKIMHRFCKTTDLPILVATDIAARGLDVKDIRTVINFDVAKNIETYVHRIGRTGRMGIEGVHPGTAYTLLTKKDSSFAVDLVHNLRLSQQEVSENLLRLASSDPKWSRLNQHNKLGRGGLGHGQRAFTSEMAAQQTASSNQATKAIHNSVSTVNKPATNAPSKIIQTVHANSGTAVRGFVRATTEYHSVQIQDSGNSVASSATPLPSNSSSSTTERETGAGRKRSRWDR